MRRHGKSYMKPMCWTLSVQPAMDLEYFSVAVLFDPHRGQMGLSSACSSW